VLHGVGARLDFAHDRIREVAYDRVFAPRRIQLHASVGQAIETVYASELAPHHGALGAHFRRGEQWEKALRYLRLGGASAVACSAHREALAYFEQAIEALEHLPEGRSRTEQAYDLGMYRVAVLYSLGELRRIEGRLGEAEAMARALEDPLRLGRVDAVRLGCLAAMGDQKVAIESGERSLTIAEATGNLPLRALTTLMLGFAHTGLGNFPRAAAYLRMTGEAVQDQPPNKRLGMVAPPAVLWRAWVILPLGELGAFREAITLGAEASQIVADTAQPYSLAVSQGTLGHLYCSRGTAALAIPALERSVALCRDYEISVLAPFTIATLGHAYAMSGRLSEALPLMEDALARGESLDVMWWQARRMVQLGEAYLLAGRADEARATVERALALSDAHGERGNRAHALRALAGVILDRDRPDLTEAEHHLGQALNLAEELQMHPLAARCQLDLGRLHRRAGDWPRARDLLTAARERLREMEMRRWMEQTDAELALAAVSR
jgi:tetratricopeptide (TPR) repeat protein